MVLRKIIIYLAVIEEIFCAQPFSEDEIAVRLQEKKKFLLGFFFFFFAV